MIPPCIYNATVHIHDAVYNFKRAFLDWLDATDGTVDIRILSTSFCDFFQYR